MARRSPVEWFDYFRAMLAAVVAFGGIGLSFLAAFGLVAYQIIVWARSGEWHQLPLSLLLEAFGIHLIWPFLATDWVGLAKVAKWLLGVHVSVYVALIGALLSWMLGSLIHRARISRMND